MNSKPSWKHNSRIWALAIALAFTLHFFAGWLLQWSPEFRPTRTFRVLDLSVAEPNNRAREKQNASGAAGSAPSFKANTLPEPNPAPSAITSKPNASEPSTSEPSAESGEDRAQAVTQEYVNESAQILKTFFDERRNQTALPPGEYLLVIWPDRDGRIREANLEKANGQSAGAKELENALVEEVELPNLPSAIEDQDLRLRVPLVLD